MKNKKKPDKYWTLEKCKEIALKYENRVDLKKQEPSLYTTAVRYKWLKDICEHMGYMNKYWNDDSVRKEALKYKNRTDFQRKSKGAYEYSKRNNMLDEVCSHMEKMGDRFHRCIYVFEFENNVAYIGLTYNLKIRENDHLRKGKLFKYLKNNKTTYVLKQLTDYVDKKEARKLEEKYMDLYEKNGWFILNENRISTLGGSVIKWNYEKCKEEALKYKHKSDFLNESHSAALSAMNNNWYLDITQHMIPKISKRCWKPEEIDFLIKNYPVKGNKYCSDILNKTRPSIKSMVAVLRRKNLI